MATNLHNENLDTITKNLVKAILDETILNEQNLIPKVRALLRAWMVKESRPVNYDNIKTNVGLLQKTIEQRGVERDYFKKQLYILVGENEMHKTYYPEIDKILKEEGFMK